MPYITPEEQTAIKANYKAIQNPGQLNFLITQALIQSFMSHPKYEMLHVLKRDFVHEPKKNSLLTTLETELCDRFTVGDIRAAASLAFDEFYRRVGSYYEEKKKALNGDLPEYVALLKVIDSPPASPSPAEEEAALDKAIEGA